MLSYKKAKELKGVKFRVVVLTLAIIIALGYIVYAIFAFVRIANSTIDNAEPEPEQEEDEHEASDNGQATEAEAAAATAE